MTKVLVVDDDLNLRQVIVMFLKLSGYDVIEGRSGKDAVDLALTKLPDVIILDCMMPIMDGLTACSMIKSTPEGKKIPIILCTALDRKQDFVEAIKAGADDYIVKPFKRDAILEKVSKMLKKRAAEKRGAKRKKADWTLTWGVLKGVTISPPYKAKILNVSLKGLAFEFRRCEVCTGYIKGGVHNNCLLAPFGMSFKFSTEIDLMLSTGDGRVLGAKGKIANVFQHDNDPMNEVVGVSFTHLPADTKHAITSHIGG